jgi:hypothetical protein
MKVQSTFLLAALVGSASAFQVTKIPSSSKKISFASKPMFSSQDAAEPEAAVEPASPSEPPKAEAKGGALVPIKEETIEFTAGLIGGAVGLAVGGPVLGAIAAAAANYASKTDQEVGEVVQAVSKTTIEVYNYLATLDAKYELLTKAKASLEASLEKIKKSDSVDPETVKKVEDALASTTAKIKEINEEYDLVGAGNTALGVIGDLVERAVKQAGTINEEYKLTEKAMDAMKAAVEKAKSANK